MANRPCGRFAADENHSDGLHGSRVRHSQAFRKCRVIQQTLTLLSTGGNVAARGRRDASFDERATLGTPSLLAGWRPIS